MIPDDFTFQIMQMVMRAEDEAIAAAVERGKATGCGVRIIRNAPEFNVDLDPCSLLTSALTIEITPEVPAGEVHERDCWPFGA